MTWLRDWILKGAILFSSGVVACASPKPASPPIAPALPASIAISDPLEVTASAPEPAIPSVPLPPPIERPTDAACAWTTDNWPSSGLTALHLRPDGPEIAQVVGGRAGILVGQGPVGYASMDVGSRGLMLTGFVPKRQIKLYAARGFLMNGVVAPGSRTILSLSEGFLGEVSVTTSAPAGIVVLHPPLSARRPCGDLSLSTGAKLDVTGPLFGSDHGTMKILLGARKVHVLRDLNHSAEVELSVSDEMPVQAFGTRDGYSRIVAQLRSDTVVGWVKTAHLREAYGGSGGTFGYGTSGYRPATQKLPVIERRACSWEVPLVVEAEGERATAGGIRSGTRIDIVEDRGAFLRVKVEYTQIFVRPGVLLLARAADLKGCRKL